MLVLLEGGIYKLCHEIGSGVMIHIPTFIKIGSGIQKSMGEDTHTHTEEGDLTSQLLLFQNKGSRLSLLIQAT
jgi:hypothetical protein